MLDKTLNQQRNGRRQESSGNPQERASQRREKGLWSFLTWSFFISQVVTAEQAAATAAQAAGSGEETASPGDAASGQGARSALQMLDPVAPAETSQASAGATIQGTSQDAAPADFAAIGPMELGAGTDSASTDGTSSPRQASASSTAALSETAEPAEAPETGADPGGGGVIDPPPIEPPPLLDPILPPVVDVLDDIIQAVAPVLDQVLAPVTGLVGGVVEALDPLLDQVVAPVTGLVGDVVGDVVQVLDPLLDQVVAPVTGLVGDVVGDVVPALDPVLDQVVAPVIAPVADILGGPLGSLLGLGSGEPIITASVVAANSGSIDFEGPPANVDIALDDLFSGGSYSDYNLALQADASVNGSSATAGILPDVDVFTAVDIEGDAPASEDEQSGYGNHNHIGLHGILGDIGLHGLGL